MSCSPINLSCIFSASVRPPIVAGVALLAGKGWRVMQLEQNEILADFSCFYWSAGPAAIEVRIEQQNQPIQPIQSKKYNMESAWNRC
jgi:hypothetical protein